MVQSSAVREVQQQEAILNRLRSAGRAGASRSSLGAKSQVRQRALESLVEEGQVVSRAVRGNLRYWVREAAPSPETVGDSLDAACRKKSPILYTKQDLKRLLAAGEQPLLEEALPGLVERKVLYEFQRGKSRYYLHLGSLWQEAGVGGKSESTDRAATATDFSGEAVRQVYLRLVEESGFPFVMIHRLWKESGQDLEALKQYLLDERAAGRAELSEADWSIATDEERAAAICEGRERYLNVRLG